MYKLVVICSMVANISGGNMCVPRTVATGLTQEDCNKKSLQLSLIDDSKNEMVYCIPEGMQHK